MKKLLPILLLPVLLASLAAGCTPAAAPAAPTIRAGTPAR